MSDPARSDATGAQRPIGNRGHRNKHGRQELTALSLGALGVVYGDIGTSPLYAMSECLAVGKEHALRAGADGRFSPSVVLGVLSLFFWALMLVVERLCVSTKGGSAVALVTLGAAPGEPGFFQVAQQGEVLVDGAARFADPREADFRHAASMDTIPDAAQAQARRSSREDVFTSIWVLLLGAVLVANWHFGGRSRS